MIDFMQILELEDKYMGTMEQVGKEIGNLSAHTLLDKFRFFELAVFNFIIGNNDMHLKNFSMIRQEEEWVLTPAYDLLNVKIVLPKDKDEFALKLGGKNKNQIRSYFEQFGTVLGLNEKQILSVFKRIEKWLPKAQDCIQNSFLNDKNQNAYLKTIEEGIKRLRIK